MIRAVVDPSVRVSAFIGDPDAAPGRPVTAGSERHPGLAEVSPSVRDPADDYLVALAREAHADALVSLDRDLLDAGLTDIAIERPAALLERLRESSG